MRWVCFCALFVLPSSICLSQPARSGSVSVPKQRHNPISHPQVCARFSDAVVEIIGGGESFGTGFIVSNDGFILTAAHVVRDKDGKYFSAISVKMPDGRSELATAIPMTVESVGQDFALLKVNAKDAKTSLPFLALGSVKDVVLGGEATIIGYPFSALTAQGVNVFTKFCLSAAFAATDLTTVQVNETNRAITGVISVNKDVKVDVIYFQGPSIKGISGSPIISLDTGRVVGIVSVKLTGIGNSLMELKQNTEMGSGLRISGMDPGKPSARRVCPAKRGEYSKAGLRQTKRFLSI